MRLEWFISSSCNIQDFGAYKLTFLFYTARVKFPCRKAVKILHSCLDKPAVSSYHEVNKHGEPLG